MTKYNKISMLLVFAVLFIISAAMGAVSAEPNVTANLTGGTYNTTQTIELISNDTTATIYYANDTTDPRNSVTRITYTEPVIISTTTTLRYAAIDSLGNWSPLYLQNYVIGNNPVLNNTGQSTNLGPQTNTTLSSFSIGSTISSAPVIGSDGTIYIAGNDGKLYAFNPDGTLKWTYTTGNSITVSPTIGADGTIYLGSTDGNLYALNPTGTLKWNTTIGSVIKPITLGTDGRIYVWGYCTLYALVDNETESITKWSYTVSVGSLNAVRRSSPVIGSDGTLYFGCPTYLYAFNPDGTMKWRYRQSMSQNTCDSAVIGSDGTLYVLYGSYLTAITDNGTSAIQKWTINPGNLQTGAYLALGDDGTIYWIYSRFNIVYAITDNGTSYITKWTYNTLGAITTYPVIGSDGTIYLSCNDNSTYALNPDGTLKWTYTFGSAAYNARTIGSDGILYVADTSTLYAFRDPVPVANFTATPANNGTLTVQFNDTSSYAATWAWDFDNDGTIDSAEQNPVFIYSNSGTYTVKLTATNLVGSDAEIKYVTVDNTAPVPLADISSGSYDAIQTVNLTAIDNQDPNPKIYYTTNGIDPTTSSTLFTGPITIDDATTLKFIAVDEAGNQSPVQSETYNIKSNVYVDIIPSNPNPKVGDKVTYTFKLGNTGPGTAKNVVFTWVIPEGLEYVGADKDQGEVSYNPTTRTLTWTLGDLGICDPYLWLHLNVVSAGNYNINPTVSVTSYNPNLESIGSLVVKAVSAPTTVSAATKTSTVPMQTTGVPLTGAAIALLLVGSGLALSRRK